MQHEIQCRSGSSKSKGNSSNAHIVIGADIGIIRVITTIGMATVTMILKVKIMRSQPLRNECSMEMNAAWKCNAPPQW